MTKKIVREYRGVQDFVCAVLQEDSLDALIYSEVFPVAGISGIEKEVESESATKYYDNVPAIIISTVGADTIKANVSAVPLDILAKMTGQKYLEDLGVLAEGVAKQPYLAIGYKTQDTDDNDVYVWRYKVRASIPSSNHKTKDNGTDAEGQEITFTGVNTTHQFTKLDGDTAKAINVEVSKGLADVSKFFEKVTLVDELQAITPPPAE